ncbi:amino acid permease [Micrococcus luteus]|uniref:amino acid permease n=1 Tax=Micrococcus TaxID=1269 RepID=UPI000F44855D|nr:MULTISPECIES: amino acid permease [Micrococcus]MCD0172835.1 amino acid permease [Micrococcus luteus]MCD0184801.1 amino acid permease [Micrococcus luteus]MCF8559811.1 amino acid permease [Micrococcus yunnanensis]MCV7456584.1 amino acid permease [Micrococcus luteus]MCV7555916.1 amino acid permease [Micrococcus luteus]
MNTSPSGSRVAEPGPADAERPGQLHRGLTQRHIIFIALGTAIGTGLFYGSAGGIQAAGPGVILAFLIAGFAVFLVMRALGEMTLHEPVSGSFAAYASRYLGPFAGYVTGWTFVFELAVVIVADTAAITTYMAFWFPEVPAWAWVAATILVVGLINVTDVGNFGETEFWLTLIKVGAIVAMIFGGIILMFTGASYQEGATAGVHNLVEHGGFLPMGMLGVLTALTVVTFSFGGIETLGIAAGEAKDPEKSLPRAINTVPVRILLFYVGTMVVIMSLVPWTAVDGSTSPFVQIFDALGVPFAPHILNFVVLTAAVSAINACIYSSGRLLYAMAHDGQAPRAFTRVNRGGVPWLTVAVMMGVLVVGAVLITVDPNAFGLVAGVASFAVVFTWTMILLSHRAMRARMAAAGQRPSSFRMPFGIVGTVFGLAFVAAVVITMATTPDSRQPLLIGVAWMVVLSLAWFVTGVRRTASAHARTGSLPAVAARE